MSQITTLPPSNEKLHADKQPAFLTMPPRVVSEIIETNNKAMGTFVRERVAAWRAFSPQKKRFVVFFSVSVLLSLVSSGFAMIIVRQFTRKHVADTGR